jgi:imidazolonepropionase-like amidohydrolase
MTDKRTTFCQLLIIGTLLTSLQTQAQIIAFEHINVIPMDKEQVLYDHRVIVDDDKIVAIEPAASAASIKADRVINVQGKYMLPGFSETHYHMTSNPDEEYKMLVANGVTSVRNMAEFDTYGMDAIALRTQANRPEVLAPHFFTAGPMIEAVNTKTPADATKQVAFHQTRGYDFIKVHDNLSLDTYLTLLEAAEKANIPVIGHAQRDMPLELTLRMKSVAHMEELINVFSKEQLVDDAFMSDVIKQVKDSGIVLSPTLTTFALISRYSEDKAFEQLKSRPETAYLAQSNLTEWASDDNKYRQHEWFTSPDSLKRLAKELDTLKRLTLQMHKAGVPLMVGSDTYGLQVPGFSLHDEMQMMVDAGLPAFDVLKAATVTGARYLNRFASAGTINEGKKAEFVILSANPLNDISQTRNIDGVMLKGQWLNKAALSGLLQQVAAARTLEKSQTVKN